LEASHAGVERLLLPLARRPIQRQAVEERFGNGLSVAEIAGYSGATEKTVRNNSDLGIKALRSHYTPRPVPDGP